MRLPLRPARRSRTVQGLALVAAATLSLAACGSSDDSGSSGSSSSDGFDSVTVQLSWIKNAEFAGEFMADSKGYYTDAGFKKVTLTPGPTSTENLVASGKADFGLSNAVSTAQAIANEQAPLKMIATTYQKNPFTILSIADKGNIARAEGHDRARRSASRPATPRSSTPCWRPTASTRARSRSCPCSTTPRCSPTARSTASWPT